jgi:hypothetical protein
MYFLGTNGPEVTRIMEATEEEVGAARWERFFRILRVHILGKRVVSYVDQY